MPATKRTTVASLTSQASASSLVVMNTALRGWDDDVLAQYASLGRQAIHAGGNFIDQGMKFRRCHVGLQVLEIEKQSKE
jgi:hypothetical protein